MIEVEERMFDEMASIRKPQAIGSSYDESKEAGDQALLKRESLVSEGWEPPSHGPPSASKVLHVRNIAPSTTEEDLQKLVLPFGRADMIKILSAKNQAFIQMESIEAAEKCVAYHREFGPLVRKRRVFMQFSNYPELSDTHKRRSLFPPNRVLLLTAPQMMRLSASHLASQLSRFGPIEKVLVPGTNSARTQAFVQFYDLEVASEARLQLNNGAVLLEGGLRVTAHYSKLRDLVPKGEADFIDFSQPNHKAAGEADGRLLSSSDELDEALRAPSSLWLGHATDPSDTRAAALASSSSSATTAAASLGAASSSPSFLLGGRDQEEEGRGAALQAEQDPLLASLVAPLATTNISSSGGGGGAPAPVLLHPGFSRAVGAPRCSLAPPSSSAAPSASSSSSSAGPANTLLGGAGSGASFLEAQGSPHWGGFKAAVVPPAPSSPRSASASSSGPFLMPTQQQQPGRGLIFPSNRDSPAAAAALHQQEEEDDETEGFGLDEEEAVSGLVDDDSDDGEGSSSGSGSLRRRRTGQAADGETMGEGSGAEEQQEEDEEQPGGEGGRAAEAASAGKKGGSAGGGASSTAPPPKEKGTVLLVTGLDPMKASCDTIYALFSNYGDVVRCKRLVHKPDHALVELSDAFAAANAVHLLRGCALFGRYIKVSYSKHTHIISRAALHGEGKATSSAATTTTTTAADSSTTDQADGPPQQPPPAPTPSADDDPFYREYPVQARRRPVFKHLRSVSGPSSVLYVSHMPRNVTLEMLHDHMSQFGQVKNVKLFESSGRTQSLVEFKDVNTASTALVLSHNSLLGRNRIRVAFSKNRFPPQQPPQPPQQL